LHFEFNFSVSGICYELAAGSHTITYSVGKCDGFIDTTDAYTGWKSSFHIFVEELRVDLVEPLTFNDTAP